MKNEEIIEELKTHPSPERIDTLCRILEVNLALERDWHVGGAREALKQRQALERKISALEAQNAAYEAQIESLKAQL
jgi:hypothetical protein